MTETKLPGMVINRIDKKSTYDSLVENGEIGENDLCLVEGEDNISLGITSAAVGDIIKVKAVDSIGKPTAWEASGNTYHTLCTETLTEAVTSVQWTVDTDGRPFDLRNMHEVLLLLKMPSSIKSNNIDFSVIGNGYAFDNGSTFSQAIVKYTLFQEQKIVFKEAIMLAGTTSYLWQGENIVAQRAFLSTYDNESELMPSNIRIQNGSATYPFPEGTEIAVVWR